jgi:cystathionine gamma-synthase/methionine-gamma-lyase
MEKKVALETRAVHSADRKRGPGATPVTTPIYTAASYVYGDIADLDRVFAEEITGESYARYSRPTNRALEELMTDLEGGAGALATSSGMAAVQVALHTALADRKRSIVAANALYGATVNMLLSLFEPHGVTVRFADIGDTGQFIAAIEDSKPGAVLVETISNPLLRVAALDRIAEASRKVGAALVVDSTFSTPMMIRPLEWGGNLVVHSLTKYLSGHGDVLGGCVIADQEHLTAIRAYGKLAGPVLGPFDSYLSMRIKTFPLRFERQCSNACRTAQWLAGRADIERVYYPGDPRHPDAPVIDRLFAPNLRGAVVSFEVRDAGRDEIFRILNSLRMIVPATSVGDVHTMVLYPTMSSHREISPKQRERMGIRPSLLRLSLGIEAVEDIQNDLAQALEAR